MSIRFSYNPAQAAAEKRKKQAEENLVRLIGEAAPYGGTVAREPVPGGIPGAPTPLQTATAGTTLGASVNVPGENMRMLPLQSVPEFQTSVAQGLAEGSPLAARLTSEAPLTGPAQAKATPFKGDVMRAISLEMFGTDDPRKLTSTQVGEVRRAATAASRQERTAAPPRPTDIRKRISQIEKDILKAKSGDQNSIAALVSAYTGQPQAQASESDVSRLIGVLEDEKTTLNNLLPEKFRVKPSKTAPPRVKPTATPEPTGDGEVDKFINKYVR